MVKIEARIEIFKEDDQYVGLCPELNVSSFGDTPEEAETSTREAVELFLEECRNMGTIEQVLAEDGFHLVDDTWVARKPLAHKEWKIAV